MKYIFIALVKFYQRFISPLKSTGCCRFIPTCSEYSVEAFKTRGAFVGLYLTVWRVLRCNPFCKGGYDPVPVSKKKTKQIKSDKQFLSDKAHGRK